MMRLLGHVPRRLVAASRRGPEFFNAQCQLWDAPRPPHWPLDKVLQEWHGMPEEEVRNGLCVCGFKLLAAGCVGFKALGSWLCV